MTTFTIVWGVVLLVVGLSAGVWGFRAMLTRPGWGGRYGKGAGVTYAGFALAMFGTINLLSA